MYQLSLSSIIGIELSTVEREAFGGPNHSVTMLNSLFTLWQNPLMPAIRRSHMASRSTSTKNLRKIRFQSCQGRLVPRLISLSFPLEDSKNYGLRYEWQNSGVIDKKTSLMDHYNIHLCFYFIYVLYRGTKIVLIFVIIYYFGYMCI